MTNNFFSDFIDDGDIPALDIYFTYHYDQSSRGGITRHGSEHDNILRLFTEYNLYIKHSMNASEREAKIRSTLLRFINQTDYRSLLTPEVMRRITELLRSDAHSRIENLDNLEKEVLSFVLSYISLQTQERSLAPGQEDYNLNLNMRVAADSENRENIFYYDLTSEVEHHKIWKYIFNLLFDRELIHGYTIYIYDERISGSIGIPRESLHAYDLGNIIVKSGLGYWEPWLTGSQNLNVHLELIIPKFLYDITINYQNLLPEIQDFENRIKAVEKRLSHEIEQEAFFPPPESEQTLSFSERRNGRIRIEREKWTRF